MNRGVSPNAAKYPIGGNTTSVIPIEGEMEHVIYMYISQFLTDSFPQGDLDAVTYPQ